MATSDSQYTYIRESPPGTTKQIRSETSVASRVDQVNYCIPVITYSPLKSQTYNALVCQKFSTTPSLSFSLQISECTTKLNKGVLLYQDHEHIT